MAFFLSVAQFGAWYFSKHLKKSLLLLKTCNVIQILKKVPSHKPSIVMILVLKKV